MNSVLPAKCYGSLVLNSNMFSEGMIIEILEGKHDIAPNTETNIKSAGHTKDEHS